MEKERSILHCDLNNFFASCEVLKNPELKDKPVAVGGKEEDRHGVIVASNYLAKSYGIKCGVTTYQAKKLCKDVVIVHSGFSLYEEYSKRVRAIYLDYTDKVEVFSIDECFLDITHSLKLFGTAEKIANEIKERVKNEIGLTISVGVSFNKAFAKIGSDLKKPDAVTVITKQNFKDIIWNLKVNSLVGVGHQINKEFEKLNIITIKDLANCNREYILAKFGKVGEILWKNANGLDDQEVLSINTPEKPKSVGNSTTFYKDLTNKKDIKLGFSVIAENLIARLFEKNIFFAKTLQIVVKDSNLKIYQKQTKIDFELNSKNITDTAYKLFIDNYYHLTKIRLLGITITDFCDGNLKQASFFDNIKENKKQSKLDKTIINLKTKYSNNIISRANKLTDKRIGEIFDNK